MDSKIRCVVEELKNKKKSNRKKERRKEHKEEAKNNNNNNNNNNKIKKDIQKEKGKNVALASLDVFRTSVLTKGPAYRQTTTANIT